MQTFVSSTSSALLKSLATRALPNTTRNVLYTISANIDPEQMGPILAHLQRIGKNTIGCISAPLPGLVDHQTCAILSLPARSSALFHSTIPGKEQPQVGRYHAMRTAQAGSNDAVEEESMNHILDQGGVLNMLSIENDMSKPRVPDGLDHSREYSGLVFLSDRKPEGLLSSFHSHFRHSPLLGLIASSTPFITGRPVTLFKNQEILSEGALGFGITQPSLHDLRGIEGLEAISNSLEVTSSQANLVHTLNNSNPSQLLISAIQAAVSRPSTSKPSDSHIFNPKDEDYFLATVSANGTPKRVYNIISGDPSRGSLALEGNDGPTVGSQVQLLRRSSTPPSVLNVLPHFPDRSATFFTSSMDLLPSKTDGATDGSEVRTWDDQFMAASENGIIVGGEDNEEAGLYRANVHGSWASVSGL